VTSIRYHQAAGDEVLTEVGYLENQAAGLGRLLLSEIRRAERILSRFPQAAQEIEPGIRRYVLPKFRYSLIYSIEEAGVLILALAHHSRRPGYWVGRG
jgi:toxin ParE1/3/4